MLPVTPPWTARPPFLHQIERSCFQSLSIPLPRSMCHMRVALFLVEFELPSLEPLAFSSFLFASHSQNFWEVSSRKQLPNMPRHLCLRDPGVRWQDSASSPRSKR